MQTGGASSSSHSRPPVTHGSDSTVPGRAVNTSNATENHVVWGTIGADSSESPFSSNQSDEQNQERDLHGVLLKGCSSSSEAQDGDEEAVPPERKIVAMKSGRPELIGGYSDAEFEYLRLLPRGQLVPLLPIDEFGRSTSVGSLRHAAGACKPCKLSMREKGCKQGIFCLFCHYVHAEVDLQKKSRPCKAQRVRYKKCLQRLQDKLENEEDEERGNVIITDLSEPGNADLARRFSL